MSIRTLLLGLLLTGLTPLANASLLQGVFLDDGTQIGTWEFATASGSAVAGVVQADILLGGVQFSKDELLDASWEIDTAWALVDFTLQWESPAYGAAPEGGYDVTLRDSGASASGIAATDRTSDPCIFQLGCVTTQTSAFRGAENLVRQATPVVRPIHEVSVPEPTTLLLLGIGLAGLGFARKRQH